MPLRVSIALETPEGSLKASFPEPLIKYGTEFQQYNGQCGNAYLRKFPRQIAQKIYQNHTASENKHKTQILIPIILDVGDKFS